MSNLVYDSLSTAHKLQILEHYLLYKRSFIIIINANDTNDYRTARVYGSIFYCL